MNGTLHLYKDNVNFSTVQLIDFLTIVLQNVIFQSTLCFIRCIFMFQTALSIFFQEAHVPSAASLHQHHWHPNGHLAPVGTYFTIIF